MKLLVGLFFLALNFNHAQAGQTFNGAWWVVNSPVVSVMTTLPDGRILATDCESQAYFQDKTCIKKGETIYRFVNNSTRNACSEAEGRTPYCWYMLSLSSDPNIIYLKADPLHTMPGAGYALSMYRLHDGVWPMKN
jgi:hypothetical protein